MFFSRLSAGMENGSVRTFVIKNLYLYIYTLRLKQGRLYFKLDTQSFFELLSLSNCMDSFKLAGL